MDTTEAWETRFTQLTFEARFVRLHASCDPLSWVPIIRQHGVVQWWSKSRLSSLTVQGVTMLRYGVRGGVLFACLMAATVQGQTIVYVDDDAAPGGDGTGWPTAHRYLQDALSAARNGGEIRVAQGTYRPDEAAADPGGSGDRATTFQLINGVRICGGYRGCPGGACGGGNPDERDIAAYETVLSGDLNGDDALPGSGGTSDCCGENDTPGCDDASCEQTVCGAYPQCCENSYWFHGCAEIAAYLCCDLCSEVSNCDNAFHVVTSVDTDATAVLDGFTITGGNANVIGDGYDASGAGMLNLGGSPTLKSCTFNGNVSRVGYWYRGGGGGVFSYEGSPTLTDCTFVGNSTDQDGGAYSGDGTFINCTFTGNTAENGGAVAGGSVLIGCEFIGNAATFEGGALNPRFSRPTVVNCLFSGNSAGYAGGAVYTYFAPPEFVNCTISGNSADWGGGFFSNEASERLTNCILWGNSDSSGTGEFAQFRPGANSGAEINHSCVQGWTGWFEGVGNTGADPRLIDADGTDDIVGTRDDDLRLSSDSPCIDAGDSTAVPGDVYDLDGDGDAIELIPFDVAGGPRFVDSHAAPDTGHGIGPVVDMGAYEWTECGGGAIPDHLEPDCNENGVADSCDILGATSTDCNLNDVPDECDIAGKVSDDCGHDGVPDECEGDCNGNGSADSCDVLHGVSADRDGDGLPDECAVLYVNGSAAPGGDGLSWERAFTSLQNALSAASGGAVKEIWVARGTYKPAEPNGAREATFQLINGVGIYGGFAGDETSRTHRNPRENVTILSGDLNGDDEAARSGGSSDCCSPYWKPGCDDASCREVVCQAYPRCCSDRWSADCADLAAIRCCDLCSAGSVCDNSYRVVTGSHTDRTAVLDGVTVTAGHANGLHPTDRGGGMYVWRGSPTVDDCTFTENAGKRGAGSALVHYSSPAFTDCKFTANRAKKDGGGVLSTDKSTTEFTACTISGNSAQTGGGIYNEYGNVMLLDCTLHANSAGGGAGMWNYSGNATLTNCRFTINVAAYGVGGLSNEWGTAALVNCGFIGNSARSTAALENTFSSVTAANCTFVGNTATDGAGGAVGDFYFSDTTFENCVFAGNSASGAGGALTTHQSAPTLLNCTLVGNVAGGSGGGLSSANGGASTLTNCIAWGNSDSNGTGESSQVYVDAYGEALVDYSCVQGWTGLFGGVGNTGDDPLFVDADGSDGIPGTEDDNARLLPGSPCIDTGDPLFAPAPGDTDLDGHARVLCDRVDMGAYEFGIGDFDCNQIVNLPDFAPWSQCATGPDAGPRPAGCEPFDFDADSDVDLRDFAGLATVLAGG